ncbi:MAG: uroporphyrinogen-III synthase [bacterium]|nr:uroporphyrinogen-III synthase [bacterium]
MELAGLHVLTTRESLGPDQLSDLLAAQGARVTSIPTISLLPPEDWGPFDQGAAQLDQYAWMVFTSINAVLMAKQRMDQLGITQLPPGLKVAAVGSKTAAEIKRAGWPLNLVPKDFQAEGLIREFEKLRLGGLKIFFPRAEEGRETLVAGLGFLGAQVTLAPVYRNEPAWENQEALENCLANDPPHWITFTSGSTVRNFFSIVERLPNQLPRLASIGKVTTAELRKEHCIPDFTAHPQTLEGLVQGMIDKENHDPSL